MVLLYKEEAGTCCNEYCICSNNYYITPGGGQKSLLSTGLLIKKHKSLRNISSVLKWSQNKSVRFFSLRIFKDQIYPPAPEMKPSILTFSLDDNIPYQYARADGKVW